MHNNITLGMPLCRIILDTLHMPQVVNTPMLPTKFVHIKHLDISVSSGRASLPYDYFSLVSFLDASPSLETLSLDVRRSFILSCKDIFMNLLDLSIQLSFLIFR